MRQCSLDSHHTQKAWFGSLAKLSGPKSEFQSNHVHWWMLNACLALCLSFAEFNKGHKAFRSVLPFPTSSATVILWFTAWLRSPNTSQKGWRAAFPAHSQFLTSPGDSVAHESGRSLGGFLTLVIHSAPGNIWKHKFSWSCPKLSGAVWLQKALSAIGCKTILQWEEDSFSLPPSAIP